MAPLGLGGLWPGPLPAASAASAAGAEAMKTAQNSSFRGFLIVFFFKELGNISTHISTSLNIHFSNN
jgi:hypothetical protein